ncbi:hypothetical protein LCGC14_0347910 [marine sediment metagenome]|uniref:Uncharacterized protein n=1 Tax=marine sediment metagenome TaxID=412755 RepID=A0A0F9THK3_9ZZZZ
MPYSHSWIKQLGLSIGLAIVFIAGFVYLTAPPCAFGAAECPVGSTSVFSENIGIQGGTTFTTTIDSTPTGDRTYTIPATGANDTFALLGTSNVFSGSGALLDKFVNSGDGITITVENTNGTPTGFSVVDIIGPSSTANYELLTISNDGVDESGDVLKITGNGVVDVTSAQFSVSTAVGGSSAGATIAIPASGTGDAVTLFSQGAADGSANNMGYIMGYDGGAGYLKLASTDTDGASTDADIWRVLDSQLSIDANTTWDENVFDSYRDAELLAASISPSAPSYQFENGKVLRGRDVLIEVGILKSYDDEFVGYNDQRMAALLAGGIYQSAELIERNMVLIEELINKVNLLENEICELKEAC